jgi:hypothetical protein
MNLTPEPEEIVQSEEDVTPLQPLPTYVCGPVETRELPGVRVGYKTEPNVTTSLGIRLLQLEPRRKSATIIAADQAIWVATSQAGAQSGAAGAMRIPVDTPLVVDHMDEVWACSVTGTATVGVASTYWSE